MDNVTNDVNEIRKNCAIMPGTGFFVDDKGMILTNRHVAQPYIEESDIKLDIGICCIQSVYIMNI